MGTRNSFSQGDLVQMVRQGTWTVCNPSPTAQPLLIKECPVPELEVYSHPATKNIYNSLEGKFGLIVYVSYNHLQQVIGYRVLIEGKEMFCKSIVADKYFKLVENQGDESR